MLATTNLTDYGLLNANWLIYIWSDITLKTMNFVHTVNLCATNEFYNKKLTFPCTPVINLLNPTGYVMHQPV